MFLTVFNFGKLFFELISYSWVLWTGTYNIMDKVAFAAITNWNFFMGLHLNECTWDRIKPLSEMFIFDEFVLMIIIF